MAKTTCTIQDFHSALRARDPLGLGFNDSINPLLHMVWGLLAWNPKERLTAADALNHFYFTEEPLYDGDTMTAALQHQTLDPRLDLNLKDQDLQDFTCPKCGRVFDNLHSCQTHAHGRRHAKFCNYDRSQLPKCLNAHSMLPSHPTSGEFKTFLITDQQYNYVSEFNIFCIILQDTATFRAEGKLSKISIPFISMILTNFLAYLTDIIRTSRPSLHPQHYTNGLCDHCRMSMMISKNKEIGKKKSSPR